MADFYHYQLAAEKQIKHLEAENQRLSSENARLQSEFQREYDIVDRIWKQLGNPTFEELNGRYIYDLIREIQQENAGLRTDKAEWLKANGPGGWIDQLRVENAGLREDLRIDRALRESAEKEADGLRERVAELENESRVLHEYNKKFLERERLLLEAVRWCLENGVGSCGDKLYQHFGHSERIKPPPHLAPLIAEAVKQEQING